MKTFIEVLLIVVGILNFMVGLGVLSRNTHKPLNITFFLLAFGVAAWVFGIAAFEHTNDANLALHWAQFYYTAPLIIVASSVVFADTFPSGGKINRTRLMIAATGFALIAGLHIINSHWLLGHIVYHPWGKEVTLHPVAYIMYSIYLAIAFSMTLVVIFRKTFTEKGLYRQQAGIFFDGYLISCVLGVFFNLALPGLGNYRLIWIGPLASSFYVAATAYGIIKHRLFDIRLVVARSVGYVLALLVLGTLFGSVVFTAVGSLFGSAQDVSNVERGAYAVIAMFLAVAFQPLKMFFDRITAKLFYHDAYTTEVFINDLNHLLVSTLELDELLNSVAKLLQETLKANYCDFVVNTPSGRQIYGDSNQLGTPALTAVHSLMAHNTDRVVMADYLDDTYQKIQPLLQQYDISVVGRIGSNVKGEVLGYLLLGAKRSGNPYNRQDGAVFEATVNELLIAIQNALRFEEIENFNLTLQQKVEQATTQLRHTNDKLRKLDETKDDFISMASHQLRTPLTSVKGYLSMVLEGDAGKLSESQRKLLEQSFVSSQRMVYLISDLLNLSRLNTGRFIIEPTPIDLSEVIQEEVSQLAETAKSRDLTLLYEHPENFPMLMLDENKIHQVVMNFLDNAIYYTPSGGTVTVGLHETPTAVICTIKDTGIGVPRAVQHKLFSKFYRAQNAQQARPDGTGLGLFMAKKVVAAQGGSLIFESEEGKGSTFGFRFSKSRVHMPTDHELAQAAQTKPRHVPKASLKHFEVVK